MLDDIDFVNLILGSFYLRIFFISIGFLISIKIIGIDRIFFLKKYVEKSFLSIEKIIYWGIALVSLIYLKNALNDNSFFSLYQAVNQHCCISILLIIALTFILYDAFIFMLGSIVQAKATKKEIIKANFFLGLSNISKLASLFIPGGLLLRFALFGGGIALNGYVDKEVKSTLSKKIKKTVKNMIKIVFLNLFIVVGVLYIL